jgi:TlyA family rRNA methyltransferase/putative hemolysin
VLLLIRRYLEAGMQFTELRRSQARAVAGDLVNHGQLARDQVSGAVDEIVAMSRRRSDALTGIVRGEVSRQLSSLGLATQADLRRLERKLNSTVKKTADRAAKKATKTTAARRPRRRGGLTATVRRRLDAELVRRGLATSRAVAVEAVTQGRVLVAGAPATSPARQVAADEPIALSAPDAPFVSRGGRKLDAALAAFAVDPTDRWCVDVGASTGGFTDCLLQHGARHVFAIDVGRGQLAWTLRNDERVTVMERTNVRMLAAGALDPVPDLCVVDVSFICSARSPPTCSTSPRATRTTSCS